MWNMSTNSARPTPLFFGCTFLFLLLWAAYDYGGRYLHIQTFSQVLSGGLLLWCARKFAYPETFQQLRRYPLLWPSVLWLLSLCISWIFSVNQLASLEEIARIVMYFGLGLSAYLGLGQYAEAEQRQGALYGTLRALVGLGLVMAALGWLNRTDTQTLAGTFYRTNDLAGYLLLLAPLAVGGFFEESGRWRLFHGLSSLVLILSVLVTNSRTSWIAMGLSMSVLLWHYRQRFRQRSVQMTFAGIGLVLMTGLVLNWQTVGPRLATLTQLSILQENATSWRVYLLQSAWDMFKERPVIGCGPNTYGIALPAFMQAGGRFSVHPHNYYLQVLAEQGLVGAAAILCWLGCAFWHYRKSNNRFSPAIGAALLASLIHIGFDIDWSVAAIPILFFTLAGIGLVRETPDALPEVQYIPYINVGRGMLAFVGLALVLVPTLNYYSARAYVDAIKAQSQRELEQAQQHIQWAMQLAPWPSGKHYYAQASFYEDQKQYPQALISGLKSIQIDPYNARYYTLVSKLLLRAGRTEQAAALLERRLKNNPYRHPELYTELAEIYWRKLKRPQVALEIYERGKKAFSEEALARYERYTPSDRYERFMLLQGMEALLNYLGEKQRASALQQEAQDLLKKGPREMYIQTGNANPTVAIAKYWQAIDARDVELLKTAVHPQAPFEHPPTGIFGTEPTYTRAERDITTALLQYTLPLKKAPGIMTFETQLIADDAGWKIIAHRPIENSQPFLFEDLFEDTP